MIGRAEYHRTIWTDRRQLSPELEAAKAWLLGDRSEPSKVKGRAKRKTVASSRPVNNPST